MKRTIADVQKKLSDKHGIAKEMLKFAGVWDELESVGKVLFLFHVTDETHEKYRSTLSYSLVQK